MKSLLLLSCSARKRHDAGPLPALDRYDGPAFRVLRKALREHPRLSAQIDIYIVSAEFGLIRADTPIPDYDRQMTAARAKELAPKVQGGIEMVLGRAARQGADLFVSLGARYWEAIGNGLPVGGLGAVTIAGGGIGQRSAQLKAWLSRKAAEV